MYEIEKNVPIPVRMKSPIKKYPFADMDVGDSFLATEKSEHARIRGAANQHRIRTGHKFRSATDENGYLRVWRVE